MTEKIELTREGAIAVITGYINNPLVSEVAIDAFKMAINALELIGHLNNRPCEACEFKVDGNCQKWACVFDEAIYGKGAGLNG